MRMFAVEGEKKIDGSLFNSCGASIGGGKLFLNFHLELSTIQRVKDVERLEKCLK